MLFKKLGSILTHILWAQNLQPEEHRCRQCCSKTKAHLTSLWAQNEQISGQKSIAVVDAVQKLSSILTHTLWAQNWQITGQKSIAVVDVAQKLRLTPLWAQNQQIYSQKSIAVVDAVQN